ncbi:protein of unknown function [Xenorhabdus poinarii G6]|uniref:Uncharacterized protein n=1 Tax=Xenorhabdus poinarii G6 TaxID=1354304 RepID=A0A068QYC1_9GAMM|nr:protein of unknown function [Xenorhabdus poinarii G6]
MHILTFAEHAKQLYASQQGLCPPKIFEPLQSRLLSAERFKS